jgi:N-acetylglucosaminyldiphosphoundecaprenol N-acetyl-beta-D-mannosaminyltransferase
MDKNNRFESKKVKKNNSGFNLSYWKMFDISLFGSGMNEVLKIVEDWIESKAKGKFIATVNPEFVMKAINDDEFRNLLKETDLNVVDGVGLVWAKELNSRLLILNDKSFLKKILIGIKVGGEIFLGKNRKSLVTGVDLMTKLCELAAKNKYKVFFLGGFKDRAERTMKYFKSKSLGVGQMDYCEGEPGVDNKEVLTRINKFKPDILFVAYGMRKQEEWISNNKDKIDFGVAIGVGRSFDYYSGDLKRASNIWRRMGMEWFYSLIKEPKRWRRQLELPKFVWKVLKSK